MPKRLRRTVSIQHCVSPRPSYLVPHSVFCRYEEDLWLEIAKHIDGRSLVMLGVTNKWFHRIIMEESVWKYACLRDLQVPLSRLHVTPIKWFKLYASAFDGSHSFLFRHQEKHIDWMRIGAFSLETPVTYLTERLISPSRIPKEDTVQKMLQACGACIVKNVKTGIWIADLQLVRCPVCDLNTCDGTMQTLDARHIELFLNEGFQDGSWDYEMIGSHNIPKQAEGASGAIFDIKYLKDQSSSHIFNLKSWTGKHNDWQPKGMITLHAVAVNTNLQENEVMECTSDGPLIRFPFKIQGDELRNCSYPGFDLWCMSGAVLRLPYSGDFYVQDINYLQQDILISDPGNCLPRRLLELNLSGTPFAVSYYQNYTFLRCPAHLLTSQHAIIDCLSNSTSSILATPSISLAQEMSTPTLLV